MNPVFKFSKSHREDLKEIFRKSWLRKREEPTDSQRYFAGVMKENTSFINNELERVLDELERAINWDTPHDRSLSEKTTTDGPDRVEELLEKTKCVIDIVKNLDVLTRVQIDTLFEGVEAGRHTGRRRKNLLQELTAFENSIESSISKPQKGRRRKHEHWLAVTVGKRVSHLGITLSQEKDGTFAQIIEIVYQAANIQQSAYGAIKGSWKEIHEPDILTD